MKADRAPGPLRRGSCGEHVGTARRDVFGLRLQHATGELENTARPS